MIDLIFVVTAVVLFLLGGAYVRACGKLQS
jgi:hypothetical protein